MTNRLAIWLLMLLAGLLALDGLAQDSAGTIFLGRKFMELLQYLAFWR
jgi:hypothetical protein